MSKLVLCIFERYAGALGSAILLLLLGATTIAPAGAQTAGTLCVLVPHFKDDYWLSVAFGLEEEAARQNVDLILFEAGGYQALDAQIDQIRTCADMNLDGILLGAVSSDHPDLLLAVSDATVATPVYGLVNELHSDALSGRIGVDWRDMGRGLGAHLATRFPTGTPSKTAVLISGPEESGWASPLETGLRAALAGSAVEIVQVYNADTGLREQLDLVQRALSDHRDIDLLIGSAPAIEAAMGIATTRAASEHWPLLFSTYVNHNTKRGLLSGSISAAPFDDPSRQGVLAIRQAIAALEPRESGEAVGPPITLLEHGGAAVADILVSPPGYFPELN
ncbi:MAG: TMAO reductase system periplasmic protein TorT [Pseudomonadota bacterium]